MTEAERFAQARQDFADAMARGVSILKLREQRTAERLALRQRARATVTDHTADLMAHDGEQPCGDFRQFDAQWMMRD